MGAKAYQVVLDARSWRPTVVHHGQEWFFGDTGSGGKKTLFNVCYALAVHTVAMDRKLPLPNVLIVDSPTKNINEDENPELVRSLYDEMYSIAQRDPDAGLQFLLIDSELVQPSTGFPGYSVRRMAGEEDALV